MFYCDLCREKNGWPMSLFKSMGPCELCRKTTVCNDVPSGDLPWPVEKQDEVNTTVRSNERLEKRNKETKTNEC